MSFIRFLVVSLFLGLAAWALYLNFLYGDTAWVGANSELGKFLARTLITLGPELAGIVIGVVTIDYLNERRQDAQLLKQLILQMGSSHNDVTDTAVRALRSYGWLTDGSFEGAYLRYANLQGINLWKANLRGANLEKADLRGANLEKANLQEAVLFNAELQKTRFAEANLEGANLREANLERADLSKANLQGVNDCTIAQLLQAKTLEGATMPDGSKFEDWILRIPEDEIDPRAKAEIDRLMREHKSEEEE